MNDQPKSAMEMLGQKVGGGVVIAATIPGHEYVLIERPDGSRFMASTDSPLVRPAPKPVLPTTPGSVVRHGVLWLLDDDEIWYYKDAMMTRDSMNSGDFEVKFDAGAHDEGETGEDADEPYYQAVCGSWDCRAPECKPKDL